MTDFRRVHQADRSRLQAWLLNLPLKKRAVLVAAMGLATVALSVPYGASAWTSASMPERVALSIAWPLLAIAGVVSGLRSRRLALTVPLDRASVEQRVRRGLTLDRLLLSGGIAVLAAAGATGQFWRPAVLSGAGPYCAPAFVLLAAGFRQRGDKEALHQPG